MGGPEQADTQGTEREAVLNNAHISGFDPFDILQRYHTDPNRLLAIAVNN